MKDHPPRKRPGFAYSDILGELQTRPPYFLGCVFSLIAQWGNGAYLRDFPIVTSYLLPALAFCGSKSSFVQVRSNLRTSMNTGTSSKRIQ
jgi:hypothetical protein